MNKIVNNLAIALLLVTMMAMLVSPKPAAAQQGNIVNLTFSKAASAEGVWEGTVDGDVQGNLRTILLEGALDQLPLRPARPTG
jgi:hypothetical protein